jgi:hypothetical protein
MNLIPYLIKNDRKIERANDFCSNRLDKDILDNN